VRHAPEQPSDRPRCARVPRRHPRGAPSLEDATKLPKRIGNQCTALVYPNCGEAVVIANRRVSAAVDRSRKVEGAKNPERTKGEAVRRARTMVRRYCTEHRLTYMWTLTYAGDGEHDLAKVRRHVERLIAAVAAEQGGRFPYLWVPELHKSGHGIHVHMAVPFYFDQKKLTKLWGRGHVWCSSMGRRGTCGHARAKAAAGYVSKYVGKAFEVAEFGRHRYERAQGFPVTSYRVDFHTLDDGQDYVVAVFACAPSYVWDSSTVEEWAGPPCRVLFFMGRAPDD